MDLELETILKKAIGYVSDKDCCEACKYYVPADESGAINAKPAHCTFNPSFELPVERNGRCRHFDRPPLLPVGGNRSLAILRRHPSDSDNK